MARATEGVTADNFCSIRYGIVAGFGIREGYKQLPVLGEQHSINTDVLVVSGIDKDFLQAAAVGDERAADAVNTGRNG